MAGAGESRGDFRPPGLPQREEITTDGSSLARRRGVLSRFQDERDRTVVEDMNVHQGLKDAGLDLDAEGLDGPGEMAEELRRPDRLLGPVEARPAAFADRGGQSELRDGQDLAADVRERKVHFVLGVREDPELDD